MKTVRELIEELQKLEQDKPVWVLYDAYTAFEPTISPATGEEYTEEDSPYIKNGDYVIDAW